MSKDNYEKVARECSEFKACRSCGCTNSSKYDETNVSCTNCIHFNASHHCELNLYDRIADQHNYR